MAKPVMKKKKKVKAAPVKQLTRKEIRKQKQLQKKENKRAFFSGKPLVSAQDEDSQPAKSKKPKPSKKIKAPVEINEKLLSCRVASDDDESIDSDFSDAEVDARLPASIRQQSKPAKGEKPSKKPKKEKATTASDAEALHRRELQRQRDLEQAARKNRIKQMRRENEEEDRMIARLEKKLKLNKSKDKNRLVRKMFNDGLDYALEFCLDDEEEAAKRELKEKRKEEREKAEQWSDEDFEDNGFEDLLGGDDGDESEGGGDDFGEGEDDGSDGEGEDGEGSAEDDDGEGGEKEEQYKEDIYGRKRDKDGNLVTNAPAPDDANGPQKYIPPHQRALMASQGDAKLAEQLERLRKHCKGLLNRLSEANLHKISASIEELYMKNSRNNMNETLARLLNEALLGRTLCNERMVQEHMVLLAFLHAQVGSEIGAHFLQTYVELFEQHLQQIASMEMEDKRLNNLILVLAYMYLFKIYEHRLLLQIIDRLGGHLGEKAIECLLLLFQSVGFKLRKDDPLAFKEMMSGLQQKIAAAPLDVKENLRLKFMVDILNAVKNNNMNKIPQFDPQLGENLRKQLKAMLRNDKYVVTLNIGMDDLLRADQVGKWWVVGSAWSGNIQDVAAAAKNPEGKQSSGSKFSEKLLKLAKEQKMNTEERRNIFCLIMSAEDYVDAFEKILHLSLRDQRSIAYVIIHCCLNEKSANPYYSHLALKFCNYNRKFQLAFQFASWDRLNDIDALGRQQIRNLAKFLRDLVLGGGLVLSVLKVVNFLELGKASFLFMKETMVGLLLHADEKEVYAAFERVAKNTKLQQFKNSLRLFMQHFLLREGGGAEKLKLGDEQMDTLQRRIEYVDNILAYVDL